METTKDVRCINCNVKDCKNMSKFVPYLGKYDEVCDNKKWFV